MPTKVVVRCAGSGLISLDNLAPLQGKLKKLTEDRYKKLSSELKNEGFCFPFFIWRKGDTGFLIDGHQRTETLIRLRDEGAELPAKFPCVDIHAKDEKDAKRKILAASSQYGIMDADSLFDFVSTAGFSFDEIQDSFEFPEIDFDEFKVRFDELDLENPEEGSEERSRTFDLDQTEDSEERTRNDIEVSEADDEVPEIEKNAHEVREGDIWKLGEHFLMCGDSTNSENVKKLLFGIKPEIIFTDPPYNLQQRGQTKRTNKSETKREDFGEWDVGFNPKKTLEICLEQTGENAHIFVCTSNYLFGEIHSFLEEAEVKPNYLVWCKNNPMPSLSKNRFVQATELVVHAIKGKPAFNYPDGQNAKNWFQHNVEPHSTGHPSQKPIGIINEVLKFVPGQNILDLFLGSGSTLIYAEKSGRRCLGMELSPHFCSIVISRWQSLTGGEAVLLPQ